MSNHIDIKECHICGSEFTGYGNNPEPFEGETCCNECNDRFVIPVRMCLGRNYDNKPLLSLLQTIAEIGKRMHEAGVESRRQAWWRQKGDVKGNVS